MSGRRILVVEDNTKNLKLVRDVLQFAGFEIIEATTGEDGVELMATEHPDLVLMDLQLPGIDGAEALRQIREMPDVGQVPVLAVTAFVMDEDRRRASQAGSQALSSRESKNLRTGSHADIDCWHG